MTFVKKVLRIKAPSQSVGWLRKLPEKAMATLMALIAAARITRDTELGPGNDLAQASAMLLYRNRALALEPLMDEACQTASI